METNTNKQHYGSIDGLRTIAAIGILAMHVAANNSYAISGFLYDSVIGSFGNFVFLFMVISAFGMCAGYYDRIINNQISIIDFYKKRFVKILPFFSVLVLVDLLVSPSLNSLYEGFADITLLFGLLPNAGNISVIGVGWFIGLVFVFYLCFPFFCCLISTKKRAWISFAISLIYNFACSNYFNVGRSNILYSACFFLAGGLIYLYRDELKAHINKWIMLLVVWLFIAGYYLISDNVMFCLLVSSLVVIYAIISWGGVLQNRFTSFISSVSMEIYLSHMFIFRIIEKLKLNTVIGNGWIQYLFTVTIVFIGSVVFSLLMQKTIQKVRYKLIESK